MAAELRSKPHNHKKLLLITRNLPPLIGGMERLNWNLVNELTRHSEVHVVAPKEAGELRPSDAAFTGVRLKPLWQFLLQAGWRSIKISRTFKPQIVLAGSGLTAPLALLAARLCNAKAAAYVHGLDVAVRHPIYRLLWIPAIRSLDIVIANSTPTRDLVNKLGTMRGKTFIVHPGVSLPEPPAREDVVSFLKKHDLEGRMILLSVGRLAARKGLREFVQNSLSTIIAAHPKALLVVIGDAPSDSLHAKAQTPQSIQAAAEAAGLGNHIRFLGRVAEETLSCAYWAASVHIFPVRAIGDDPEGFGMVAIEAAAHGLPTVAFATGGIIDAVSDGASGCLVSPGDYAAFSQKTVSMLDDPEKLRSTSMAFAEGFQWGIFGRAIAEHLEIAPPDGDTHAM